MFPPYQFNIDAIHYCRGDGVLRHRGRKSTRRVPLSPRTHGQKGKIAERQVAIAPATTWPPPN